ncbi:MAG: peptide chain release factor N(5)-glutamine methyltransferase [Chitinophagaceae bacterium]|nr:MAG: peptide chain release factor N(5)-glutamine methyltransferase [Chitinophagaceae bacterium]
MTYRNAAEIFRQELQATYTEDESLIFLSMILDTSRVDLLTRAQTELAQAEKEKVMESLERLIAGEPIQYITGEAYFFGHTFHVNTSVLIPRPETEELVDWVIKSVDKSFKGRILDIGTGSGCIPISLKLAIPDASINGVDISADAIEVARKNADLNRAEVNFSLVDILRDELAERYDIFISNPPYITKVEQKEMAAHVLEHEPHLALFVKGNDPLEFYRAIAEKGRDALSDEGVLFFEINELYGSETTKMLRDMGYKSIELRKDMQGKDRMIRAVKAH